MGAIAGIRAMNGAPVPSGALARMSTVLAHRGPVGEALWVEGGAGLVHRRDRIEPPVSTAGQPLADPSGRYRIVLSGRVFNWRELAASLARSDPDRAPPRGCLETLLRDYLARGTTAFAQWNGGFACAIWDASEQRMLVARDHFGVKPLYYIVTPAHFVFASEIKALLAHPDITAAPDDRGIFDFLSVNRFLLLSGTTCYAGVRKLLPGHWIEVGPGGVREGAYWRIDPERKVDFSSDEERVEAVREIMVDAVRIRMPEGTPFGAALSGGFDSSSVVCLLADLLGRSDRTRTGFETFSYTFGTDDADETHLVDLVARHAGTTHHALPVLQPDFFDDLDNVILANDGPVVESTALLLYKKKRLIGARGLPVSFSGIGGDELFQGQLDYFADLLRAGRLVQLVREIRAVHPIDPITGRPTSLRALVRAFALSPLWPQWMRRLRGTHNGIPYPPDWIAASLLGRAGVSKELPDPARPRFASHYDQSCWDLFFYELVGGSAHYHDCASAPFGVDTRFPLMDLRLVETMFATPRTWKYREGRVREMQKRAMAPYLPREVLEDHIKKDHHPTVIHFMQTALREPVRALLEGDQQLARAYVDWNSLRRHAEPFFSGRAYNSLPIWLAMALERWLRLSFGRP